MYVFYSGPNDRYASAGISKRNGSNTSVDVIYLGRVIDKEAGIYKSRERGMFTFDSDSGEFGSVPENYVPPEIIDHRITHKHVSVDFWRCILYGYIPSCLRHDGDSRYN